LIEPRDGFNRPRWARRPTLALVLAAGLLGVVLWSPGTSSAASIFCAGNTTPTDLVPEEKFAVEYDFGCTDEIKAYTILSNKQLSFFQPEVGVFDETTGEPAGLLMFCEGNIPGFGFACSFRNSSGVVPGSKRVHGELSLSKSPCTASSGKKKSEKWKLWVIVATIQQSPTTFTTTSDPWPIGTGGCGNGNKKK
jgi:hypothetical protein